MSLIYAAGNRTAAIDNIKAAINARIVTVADGTKDLDRESLTAWIQDQFRQMLTDAEATNETAVAHGVSTRAAQLVAGLNESVRRERFMARADWPKLPQTADIGAAVRSGLAELKSLSAAVTQHYADHAKDVEAAIIDYMVENEVISGIRQGVQRIVTTQSVIATYITDWGEESEPSPVSVLFDRDQNDGLTVVVPAPPSGRNVTHFRLYIANSGSNTATFQMIANPADDMGWPIGTLTLAFDADDLKPENLQEPCPSMTWEEPPATGKYLVGMGNGIMVMASGNTVHPCEAYRPWAYPPDYQKSTSHPITGMCAADNILVVGTMGPPKIYSGSDPASLAEIRHDSGQACVSARSMVATHLGVVYASPDGLCLANSGGVKLLTGQDGFNLYSKQAWEALQPSTIIAAEHEGCYVFRSAATDSCFSLDLTTGRLIELDVDASAFYRDQLTDQLYLANGTALSVMAGGAGSADGRWKTKLVDLGAYAAFAWMRVEADFDGVNPVTVTLYASGELFHQAEVMSGVPVRVPAGRHDEWEVLVEANYKVTRVTLASSTAELKQVAG